MSLASSLGFGNGGANGGENSNSGYASDSSTRTAASRRFRLVAMAGSLYNAGRAAANEIRETYNRGLGFSETHHSNIPGAFPDIGITVHGNDQMIVFPSYAKHHIKEANDRPRPASQSQPNSGAEEQEGAIDDKAYWHDGWRKSEDRHAVVDVDVRGWVYSPHIGPLTRKNRLLIGAARQLTGIPFPKAPVGGPAGDEGRNAEDLFSAREAQKEQERIAREAAKIERTGQKENEAASRGDYSEHYSEETFKEGDPEFVKTRPHPGPSSGGTGMSGDSLAPANAAISRTGTVTDEDELARMNLNLMSRLGPFLTVPRAKAPMTMFFYNEAQSQSRTVETDDAGHFSLRASLDFVPSHVRVIANETLSAIQPVQIIDQMGVSLISDIDDTIKRSNISLGAKEIFRHTFAHELDTLSVPGVTEWYNTMYNMGVHIHYCSNSPWQLYPVLATFFKVSKLPEGSIHLKHYPGLLQGIFEPVAERKKPTIAKIIKDFPYHRFVLVGDSGEADLEVYTDLALANPSRIIAIFIRDVTTPEQPGFFDPAFQRPSASENTTSLGAMNTALRTTGANKTLQNPTAAGAASDALPGLPVRPKSGPQSPARNKPPVPKKPTEGKLIDFGDDKSPQSPRNGDNKARNASSPGVKAKPPPRPTKPIALRSTSVDHSVSSPRGASGSSSASASASKGLLKASSSRSGDCPVSAKTSVADKNESRKNDKSNGPLMASNTVVAAQASGSGTKSSGSKTPPPPPPPPRRSASFQQTKSTARKGNLETMLDSEDEEDYDEEVDAHSALDLPPSVVPGRAGTILDESPTALRATERDLLRPTTSTERMARIHRKKALARANRIGDYDTDSSSLFTSDESGEEGGYGEAKTPAETKHLQMLPDHMQGLPPTPGGQLYNKKVTLWQTRLARAREVLGDAGVKLYTWRQGQDVMKQAEGLVKAELKKMGMWQ